MIETIQNSIFGSESYHMCVAKLQQQSCYEWQIFKDFRCPGNKLDNGNKDVGGNIAHCEDFCMSRQPDCIGWTLDMNGMCNIKSILDGCYAEKGYATGQLVHYDCHDNHNCRGSFVRFEDKHLGGLYHKGNREYINYSKAQIKVQYTSV